MVQVLHVWDTEIVGGVLMVLRKDSISGRGGPPTGHNWRRWFRAPQHRPKTLVVTWSQSWLTISCVTVDGGTITLKLGLSLRCQLIIAFDRRVIRDSRQVL